MIPVIKHLKQIIALRLTQRRQSQVIQDQHIRLRQTRHALAEAAFSQLLTVLRVKPVRLLIADSDRPSR